MILTPYDPDALLMKARLFINRAHDNARDFEERAFWAVSSLELLGKAALSRISPLLIANPTDDGASLLIASGAVTDDQKFSSVQAKAVWSRCQRVVRPFEQKEAQLLSADRNAYIHAATVGFDAVPERVWWQRFWGQAAILLEHLGVSVVEFVGAAAEPAVAAHLARNKETLVNRLNALLERARVTLAQREAGTLSTRLEVEWSSFVLNPFIYSTDGKCPACDATGQLVGDEVLSREPVYLEDADGVESIALDLVIGSMDFRCPHCHLALETLDLLTQAGFDDTFTVEGDPEDYYDFSEGPEYMNE